MWDVLPPYFATGSRTGSGATPRQHSAAAAQYAAADESLQAPGCLNGLTAGSRPGTAGVASSSCSSTAPAQVVWADLNSCGGKSSHGGSAPDMSGLRKGCSSTTGGLRQCLPTNGGIPSSTAFRVLQGHTAAVTGLEVVQSSGVLVSCGRDGRLLQWDYCTGQLLSQQQLQQQELLCLSVRHDNLHVYVGTSHGQVLSFSVSGTAAAAGQGAPGCQRHCPR